VDKDDSQQREMGRGQQVDCTIAAAAGVEEKIVVTVAVASLDAWSAAVEVLVRIGYYS